MIEIKKRGTGEVIFRDENATTIKEAVIAAAKGDAYLGGAYLRGADLRVPLFYDTNERALEDIKRRAAESVEP